MVIYSKLAACPGEIEPATEKAAWATISTDTYLSEMLVNVYSYRVMEKSLSYCCVHESQIFSNPVTNILY